MIIEYSENNEARIRWKHTSTDEWQTAELDDLILAYENKSKKTGKWIPHSEKCREYIGTVLVNVEYDYWLCDTCGYRVENGQPMYKFCPNCGAKMNEVKND